MKLLMMGTGPYAVPTFRRLCDSSHNVVGLVTRPEAARRGGKRPPPSPTRSAANELGVTVFDPPDANAAKSHEIIQSLAPELLVVCDYGQILSPETLKLAPLGGINLHASLLPKYRGAAPINWAIFHGDTETGNTVIHMTPQVDGGPCIAQQRIAIGDEETADQLEVRLADAGAELVLNAIAALESGNVEEIPQDPALVSRAPKLRKSHGEIDWSRAARDICNQIRALKPWPKTYTHWLRSDREPLRLTVDAAAVEPYAGGLPAGTVAEASAGRLVVATGDGLLFIRRLQPAGKRNLSVDEFLRGYPVRIGERFGNP